MTAASCCYATRQKAPRVHKTHKKAAAILASRSNLRLPVYGATILRVATGNRENTREVGKEFEVRRDDASEESDVFC